MKLLKQLYEITSKSCSERCMQRFLFQRLSEMGVSVDFDQKGNISVVKGTAETYPCLVAHIDEVHCKRPKDYKVVRQGELFFGISPSNYHLIGIGADDKNGIWVCLKCLETFKALKCVFFVEEEIGCVGSGFFNMDFFSDCQYVIEADRKGNSDFVTSINGTPLCSDVFVTDIDPLASGYKPAKGFTTDVFMLKQRGLPVSCINLSCGYYNPHTISEMTNVADLHKCLRLIKKIIRRCKSTYPHTLEELKEKQKSKKVFHDDLLLGRYPQCSGPTLWDMNEILFREQCDSLPYDYTNYLR